MSVQNKSVEIGLKTQINRQVGLKDFQENVTKHTQTHLVDAWKSLLINGMEDDKVSEMIWDYCLSSPDKLWLYLNSSTFGIYSKIGEYENKKGYKSLAHFTENGQYLDSVFTLGKNPVGYKGYFRLSKTRFQLDITKLLTITKFNDAYILAKLFKPIPLSVETQKPKKILIIESDEEDEDDEEV